MNSQKKTQQIIQDNHLHRRIIAFLVFLSVCAGFIMPYMGISPGFAETNGVYFESQQKTIPDGAAQLQENMSRADSMAQIKESGTKNIKKDQQATILFLRTDLSLLSLPIAI